MLSTQTKGWVGTGAPKFMSAMADSKKQLTNNSEHVTKKKQTLGSRGLFLESPGNFTGP